MAGRTLSFIWRTLRIKRINELNNMEGIYDPIKFVNSFNSLLLLFKSDFEGVNIKTVLNYSKGLPLVEVIPDQIKQVFLNRLNNAKDACSKTGGVITISTFYDDQSITITIKDTGVGFAPEKK